jgi:hypothetical protein
MQKDMPDELKQAFCFALSQIGEYFWDKENLPETTASIIKLWQQEQDPQLLDSLAVAMGRMGNAQSINSLFAAILNQGTSLEEIQNSSDLRAKAALLGLERLSDPGIVPAISERLNSSKNYLEIALCAKILASINGESGMHQLLTWTQSAGDSYAPLVRQVFAAVPPGGLEYINDALSHNIQFKSAQVRQAILSALGKS